MSRALKLIQTSIFTGNVAKDQMEWHVPLI